MLDLRYRFTKRKRINHVGLPLYVKGRTKYMKLPVDSFQDG